MEGEAKVEAKVDVKVEVEAKVEKERPASGIRKGRPMSAGAARSKKGDVKGKGEEVKGRKDPTPLTVAEVQWKFVEKEKPEEATPTEGQL